MNLMKLFIGCQHYVRQCVQETDLLTCGTNLKYRI